MIPYYSKRNQVYPTLWDNRAAVCKYFVRAEDRERELALYARLGGQLPLPKVLDTPEGALVLEHLPHPSLLAPPIASPTPCLAPPIAPPYPSGLAPPTAPLLAPPMPLPV